MKILFTQAPFVEVNGEFRSYAPNLFVQKLIRTVRYFTGKSLPYFYDWSCLRKGVRAGSRWPFSFSSSDGGFDKYFPFPFIMAYSAALLKSKGYEVDIIDAVVNKECSYEGYLKEVKNSKPDIVVLECAEITMEIDLKMAKKISKFAEVALAGPHINKEIAEDIKKKAPYVKYILMGEYIKSSLKAVETRKAGIYESEIVTDFDSIPFAFRDFKNADKYMDGTAYSSQKERIQLQMYASKGCPFRCKFCLWPQLMYKGTVAQRSPKLIAEEIKENLKKHNYTEIFFDDDTFNIGTERISELCGYLKEIGLPWTMMGRLDCSPLWLYDKMVDSGCVGMRFGIETFDIECLKRINKGLEKIDFVENLMYLCNKYPDLYIHVTMMKDMPGQSEEIHKKDMEILGKMGFSLYSTKRSYQLATCSPYKGTVLYKELEEALGKKYLEENLSVDGMQDTIMTKLNREGFWEKENKNKQKVSV